MKKDLIIGIIIGSTLTAAIGVAASNIIATENPYPIVLNGENAYMLGYNIEGSTYFKLRDISDTVGGFDVDFKNDTIRLSQNGYIYNENPNLSEYVGTYYSYLDYTTLILKVNSASINGLDFEFNGISGTAKYITDNRFTCDIDGTNYYIYFDSSDVVWITLDDKSSYNLEKSLR